MIRFHRRNKRLQYKKDVKSYYVMSMEEVEDDQVQST